MRCEFKIQRQSAVGRSRPEVENNRQHLKVIKCGNRATLVSVFFTPLLRADLAALYPKPFLYHAGQKK
jgi:hypothetical protein